MTNRYTHMGYIEEMLQMARLKAEDLPLRHRNTVELSLDVAEPMMRRLAFTADRGGSANDTAIECVEAVVAAILNMAHWQAQFAKDGNHAESEVKFMDGFTRALVAMMTDAIKERRKPGEAKHVHIRKLF